MADRSRYVNSAENFYDATRPAAVDDLVRQLKKKMSAAERISDTGEEGSWKHSLPRVAEVLHRAGLDRVYVSLEFNPPQYGNRRADVVITGLKDGTPSVLVIELKQWSEATWDPTRNWVSGIAARYGNVEHPVRQAHGYAQVIQHYIEGFHPDEARIESAAYLHNATVQSLQSLKSAGSWYADRLFSGDAAGDASFTAFLRDCFDNVDGRAVAEALEGNPPKKSRDILEAAGEIFQNPDVFPLSEEQREVVNDIQKKVNDALDPRSPRGRTLIVVTGKPGSGKTWICMNLLGREAAAQRQVSFATNSTSLRETLRKVAKQSQETRPIAEMITSARTFWKKEYWGTLDVLIVDEAQRITEWTIRTGNANRKDVQADLEKYNMTQLRELASSAKVVVLMMDDWQQTTATDYLTTEKAEEVADFIGADFQLYELEEQHRSGGSKAFEAWVDSLVDDVPTVWHDEDGFWVKVADSPSEMEQILAEHSEGDPRIMAGFCWPWSTKDPATGKPYKHVEDVPYDIVIGDWSIQWNLKANTEGYPKADLWAFEDKGARQAGSIFSGQGFEFDYCGVIMGPDLRYDAGEEKLRPDCEASEYTTLKRLARKQEQEGGPVDEKDSALQRLRNGYRVLLTRGMKGVVVYSTDPATQQLLKRIVNPG